MAVCPGCGRVFTCGIEAGGSWCWCFDVDASTVTSEFPEAKCYCEMCLKGEEKPSLTDLLRRISKDT